MRVPETHRPSFYSLLSSDAQPAVWSPEHSAADCQGGSGRPWIDDIAWPCVATEAFFLPAITKKEGGVSGHGPCAAKKAYLGRSPETMETKVPPCLEKSTLARLARPFHDLLSPATNWLVKSIRLPHPSRAVTPDSNPNVLVVIVHEFLPCPHGLLRPSGRDIQRKRVPHRFFGVDNLDLDLRIYDCQVLRPCR